MTDMTADRMPYLQLLIYLNDCHNNPPYDKLPHNSSCFPLLKESHSLDVMLSLNGNINNPKKYRIFCFNANTQRYLLHSNRVVQPQNMGFYEQIQFKC
uniref:Uncharacterized protein n=1 Tax=Ditylenchus dipsaci TaxID=166011 RepID=A0A915DRP7_9BILA